MKKEISDERKDYNSFFIEPSLSLRYSFGPYWTGNMSFQYTKGVGDILDFPTSYYMGNYRYMNRGAGLLSKRESQVSTLRMAYRNTIQAFFFNFLVLYRTSYSNLLSNTSFKDGVTLVSPEEIGNRRDNISLNGYIAKYVDKLKTNFSFSGNYTIMEAERLQQNVKIPVTFHTLLLQPKIDTKVKNWLSVAYSAEILNNRIGINDLKQKTHRSFNQFRHDLNFFFFPSSQWQIKVECEYLYNDVSENVSSKLYFMDMGLTYRLKELEFSLDWTNIFNQKSYAYTIDDGLNIFSHSYRLRPYSVMFNVYFRF